MRKLYLFWKRTFDIVLSSLVSLVALPFMLIIALCVAIDSRGPVIFKQHRVGRNGRLFRIYKFRTMKITAPSEMATKDLDDPYMHITKFGKFLRKTSLDELPQLINVIKGDMSLVGPRPLIENEGEIHRLRMEYGVYTMRPGLTGWAQVNGRDNVPDEEKAQFDREYVERSSFWFDIKIMFRTILVVFKRDGYSEGKRD